VNVIKLWTIMGDNGPSETLNQIRAVALCSRVELFAEDTFENVHEAQFTALNFTAKVHARRRIEGKSWQRRETLGGLIGI
jgi:hypothetical protein